MITSPLTGGATKLVSTIDTKTIAKLYAPHVDVGRFFVGVDAIEIHECLDTGYRFYHPFSLAGDGPFYEELAKEELYYIPWKWEHEIADSFTKYGDTVLELGCGNGDFLIEMRDRKHIVPYGTELNEAARGTAEARGISFTTPENAAVTCAFQVLEHIQDVKGFFEDAIKATKPGGHIVFGIPNNDCFISHDPTCFLNMPPHHMGLWTEASLRAVAPYFGLEVVSVHKESLQPHHFRYYYQVIFGDRIKPLGFIGKVINKLTYELLFKHFIRLVARDIVGHTIVVVYRKPL